jgi:hypothetical protein
LQYTEGVSLKRRGVNDVVIDKALSKIVQGKFQGVNMQRPQYGIDAPGLLQLFAIAGTSALVICLISWRLPIFWEPLGVIITTLSGVATTYLLGMGCLMLYYSKIEKLKDCEKLLDLIQWSGDEQVLDVGCGLWERIDASWCSQTANV